MRQDFSILTFAILILILIPVKTQSREQANAQQQACFVYDTTAWNKISNKYERSQEQANAQQQACFGFDSTAWKKISNRYKRSQARAEIQMKDGSEISGQIVQIENGTMIVYPGYEVIIDPVLSNEYIKIELEEISRIKVKRNTKNYEAMIMAGMVGGFTGLAGGGILLWTSANLLTVSPFLLGGAAAGGFLGRYLQQYPRRYDLENDKKDQAETVSALKAWAVFEDTIRYYDDFRELVDHSAIVARSFPDKRLKVTAAIGPVVNGFGLNTNIDEVMSPEYPMYMNQNNVFSPGFSLSSAYRFGDKFHIGAAWFNSDISGTFRYDLADTVYYEFYPRKIKGYKFFAEYSPIAPDRYLVSRFELTGGAGMVFARSEQYVRWQVHRDFVNFYDNGEMNIGEQKLMGLTGHILANYYLSPNTSLFAGLEGYLFQSVEIPAVDELVLEYSPPLDFRVPEYTVNYSSVHMKFGMNFHF